MYAVLLNFLKLYKSSIQSRGNGCNSYIEIYLSDRLAYSREKFDVSIGGEIEFCKASEAVR